MSRQLQANPNLEKTLGKKWSTQTTTNGLWGFPGVVSLYEKFPHESLHSNSLGFTIQIIDSILPRAKEVGYWTNSFVAAIDTRI